MEIEVGIRELAAENWKYGREEVLSSQLWIDCKSFFDLVDEESMDILYSVGSVPSVPSKVPLFLTINKKIFNKKVFVLLPERLFYQFNY